MSNKVTEKEIPKPEELNVKKEELTKCLTRAEKLQWLRRKH